MGAAVSRVGVAGSQQAFRSRYVLNRMSGSMVVGNPAGEVSISSHYQSTAPYYMQVASEHGVPASSAFLFYNTAFNIAQTSTVQDAIMSSPAYRQAEAALEAVSEENPIAMDTIAMIEAEAEELMHNGAHASSCGDDNGRVAFCPSCRAVLPVDHDEVDGNDDSWQVGDPGVPGGTVLSEASSFSVVLVMLNKLAQSFPRFGGHLKSVLDSAWEYFMGSLSAILHRSGVARA